MEPCKGLIYWDKCTLWHWICRKFDCWSPKSFYQQIWRNRKLFVSNVTLTGSICLTVFFIYCVCLFPFAKFFFSFMLCYHICWWNKVVYIILFVNGLTAVLKKIKRHKAPGLSGLVAEMIQATRDIGTQWILDLCNGCLLYTSPSPRD